MAGFEVTAYGRFCGDHRGSRGSKIRLSPECRMIRTRSIKSVRSQCTRWPTTWKGLQVLAPSLASVHASGRSRRRALRTTGVRVSSAIASGRLCSIFLLHSSSVSRSASSPATGRHRRRLLALGLGLLGFGFLADLGGGLFAGGLLAAEAGLGFGLALLAGAVGARVRALGLGAGGDGG